MTRSRHEHRRRGGARLRPVGTLLAGLTLLVAACAPAGEAPAGEAEPRRIVAVAPGVVETLFELGLGERVVGVGDHVEWPPEAADRPRIGGLYDPRLELVASLEPDLAVLLPGEAELARRVRRLGVEVLTVRLDTLADVPEAMRAIAGRCGVPAAGERLAREWEEALAPRPLPDPPRVLLTLDRQSGRLGGVLVVGPGNFLHELLARLGADNVFADAPIPYPEVGLEPILARAPEAIVELQSREPDAATAERLRGDWRRFPELPAVRDGRLEIVAGSHVLLPGPRLPRLYGELAEALR